MLDDGRKTPFIILMLVSVLLSLCAIRLMHHVESLLSSDLRIGLTEIASQNRDAISSRLTLAMTELEGIARQLGTEIEIHLDQDSPEAITRQIDDYARQHNRRTQFIANTEGFVGSHDGKTVNISGRQYFRMAKKGDANISESLISLIDGEDVFVVSAPIYVHDKFAGTLQQVLDHDSIYKILLPPLFASTGTIYIVKEDGYVVIDSYSYQERTSGSGNYFRDLYANGNRVAAQQIERDARNGQSGFIETQGPSGKVFTVYAPIDKTRGWMLVVTVPHHTVFPNGGKVIDLFYFVLFLVVTLSAVGASAFIWYRARQQKQLINLAFIDAVTGGATYARFENESRRLLATSTTPYWLVKMDIDNFKFINKFHGFDIGNVVLREVYHHFESLLNTHERVARISNDDFVLLLSDVDETRLDKLFGPFKHHELHIYFSVGIYPVNNLNDHINAMVDKARMASEEVKGSAMQYYAFYTSDLDAVSAHNELLKHRIRAALDKREFLPYYQSKVDIVTGQIVGCEALARWRTADGSLVSPADFIPVCEQTSLVLELDVLIYEQSLALLHRRLSQSKPCVPISVNFSKLHLADPNFSDRVNASLEAYQVPTEYIQIEITESVFLDNFGDVEAALLRLKNFGFQIAMDDFGSGYSSLNMLKKMPIDVLKIDKEFLDLSAGSEKRDAIFAGVVQIARNIGLQVVVEGVETADDIVLMKACGCFVAQGYYFSRPMPECDFLRQLDHPDAPHETTKG